MPMVCVEVANTDLEDANASTPSSGSFAAMLVSFCRWRGSIRVKVLDLSQVTKT